SHSCRLPHMNTSTVAPRSFLSLVLAASRGMSNCPSVNSMTPLDSLDLHYVRNDRIESSERRAALQIWVFEHPIHQKGFRTRARNSRSRETDIVFDEGWKPYC